MKLAQGKTPSRRRSIPQQQLGVRLQALREEAGYTQETVAKLLRCHVVTLSKMENGRTSLRPAVVRELARIYEASAEEAERLVGLCDDGDGAGWTVPYRDAIAEPVSALADIEARAGAIFDYAPELVPAALQTSSYAEYLVNLATEIRAERRRQILGFKMERQQRLFTRNPRPSMKFVIHEAALRARVRSERVMADQISHLVELSNQKDIEVRVWPFEAGPHRWMSGAFTLLQSGDNRYPHVVYTETQVDERYVEKQEHVEQYARLFAQIRRKAVPIKEFPL
ncbi:helix-turn-helix transcriptional regulator [Kineosporia sp. NBRC 101731]|uniref:helix-turn-helix domain-containing protein n=1 Tax=Kineosporia sp. NBRC 101731 TaxID=3032199 RepID=UPI0024A2AC2C|nr:helix-turn-helix transcriptional regulator [Kineosporia sp. NBRC 101731]GLY28962.1 transcriptional regulator [Kineosporia sp. NBRC 101731]